MGEKPAMFRWEREALSFGRSRSAWALPAGLLVGGALWAAALPRDEAPDNLASKTAILAVLAFVPVLLALPGSSPRRAFAWGWVMGALWEATTLWWLAPTLIRYGGMGLGMATLLIAGLCMVLGLYMGFFLGILAFLLRRWGAWAIAVAACVWVLAEWLRGHLFTGFPWWGPGYALSLYPVLLQSAALFGVLGLSFLALLAASALALGMADHRSRPALAAALPAILLFAGACSYGITNGDWKTARSERIRVGYIQPEIPQDQKWDAAYATEAEDRLIGLSEPFALYHLKLLVWPESCTPGVWDIDGEFRGRAGELARKIGSPILVGTMFKAAGGGVQNGAVLVREDGAEGARYAKVHLVPYGEYVPFRRYLRFAEPIVESVGEFRRGTSTAPIASPAGRLGVSICFEGIFPSHPRSQVRQGAEILVNITNDAWYAGTPGPIQHYFIQRVRAVETGRYLIRSANGGVSGVVNPRGRLEMATPKGHAASFWGEVVPLRTTTLFARLGDWWLLGVIALLVGMVGWPTKKRDKGMRPSTAEEANV